MERVFDFKEAPEVSPEAAASACTWQAFDSDAETADRQHPFLMLGDPDGQLADHQTGHFQNPKRRTAFDFRPGARSDDEPGGGRTSADILRIDRRFIPLLIWLGENHITLRLHGYHTPEGFAVYRMKAVVPGGRTTEAASGDAFLQTVIRRLLASRAQEEESEEEETDTKGFFLTDLPAIMDFLACAGDAIPRPVRAWAGRNVELIRSGTVSTEEKRHAQRALAMMLNIQWKGAWFPSIDPVRARRILDEELYGLEKVKQRVIETIIQINRTHTLPAYGILLVGPAGTGKSQIAYAVARILGLPFTSLDMSTIHDSEALTGSPRIYANAKPGRIMEAFSEAGSSNLVFIINELDKADSGNNGGNPADALLTLLDNLGYTDNYIECTIPTGGVYPIATANDIGRISEPLMTRFAVIRIEDYTDEEKKTIFREFALPKVLKRMGMRDGECVITDGAVGAVVESCAGRPGCRDLEQAAEHLAANALYRIETEGLDQVVFTREMAKQLLG